MTGQTGIVFFENYWRRRGESTGIGTGDKSVPGGPYFIQLADGRYAFGYADEDGRTKALFTQQQVKYNVLWYDAALAEWQRVRAQRRSSAN